MNLLIKQIQQTVENLIEAEKSESNYEFKIIKSTLNALLRKWHDYEYPHFVSEKANEQAKEIKINLWKQRWVQQPSFDKGRKLFVMEHKYPVSDMIKDMIANPENIEMIFKSGEFGWILRLENKDLKRNNRGDHDAVYKKAGIRLLKPYSIIKAMRDSGNTSEQIAQYMNEQAIPTAQGGKWDGEIVLSAFEKRIY